MVKIFFDELKKKRNKLLYTNEPKHKNLYLKNLRAKRKYFKSQYEKYLNNIFIQKCDYSVSACAIKYVSKKNNLVLTLILQDYTTEEGSEIYTTWEFFLYNKFNDEYNDSKFFTSTSTAFMYFIDLIKSL
ncbi:MAG: hypothetical protein CMD65_03020 [Gammaproteobacteria bacterium]|nr:hypothetical protein [Gammaproteobacteria bacterium]|tara:strand:+ start:4265 stop:4654 length:390 start_codon:yes stop_codon:yes gene_type:complete